VVGVGNGATLTLHGIRASRAGQYVLVVHYANDERAGEHQYNGNIVSRATDIAVDGGPAERVWLRNTWSWDTFWSVGIPIRLQAGVNSIRLANPSGPAPNFDRFEIAPLRAAPAARAGRPPRRSGTAG
jgi:hypothetical protein